MEESRSQTKINYHQPTSEGREIDYMNLHLACIENINRATEQPAKNPT